jgi:AAA15 family ATPase/GTPase
MKMHSINIKNFKKFEDVTVEFNPDINIFTGVNNCGKTTLLEAIALWHEFFIKLIKRAERSDKSLKIKQDDYRLGNGLNYFDFKDVISVRSPNYKDLFYNLDTSKPVYIEITFSKPNALVIGFNVCRANGNNYEIHVNSKVLDYQQFNTIFQEFPCPITSIFASPVAHLLFDEEFERDAIIRSKVQQRKSIEVIRNRLHKIKDEDRANFSNDLSEILTNSPQNISYKIIGDYNSDVSISANIKTSPKDSFKDISLLGSGTLQIIEILLSIYEKKTDLNLILLDEPDSHIHRDIQKRLLNFLVKHTEKTQIFITTHNESLIRSANPNHIFHLENTSTKTYAPIGCGISKHNKQGFQETYKLKILKELGGESSLDFINALEADKIIFVEGLSDAKYIDVLMDKKYRDSAKKNIMYWSFDGVDNLLLNIQSYKTLFSQIKNEKTLWEKSLMVIDADWSMDTQRDQLKAEMKKIGSTVIFPFYTFESVLLTDLHKLSWLLFEYIKNQDKLSKKPIIDDRHSDESRSHIQEKLQAVIKEKCQKMLDEVDRDNNDFEKKIKEWQGKKESILVRSAIFKQYNFDYHNYYSFLKKELKDKNYSVIATKDDVKEICEGVLKEYQFDFSDQMDIVHELLKQVSLSTWYDQWDQLFELIY